MSEKSDKIFVWLGKLSVIVGIIYGIIQICFSLFFSNNPHIYAQCFPISIPSTPFEIEFLKNNNDFKYREFKYSDKYFMQCKIINDGNREASSVRLVIPRDILYAECKSGVAEIVTKKNVLEISSLRPETSVLIDIWGRGSTPSSWDRLEINSREVSGKVDIGTIYYGGIASFANILSLLKDNIILILTLISILIICAIISYYIESEEKKKQKTKEKQEIN